MAEVRTEPETVDLERAAEIMGELVTRFLHEAGADDHPVVRNMMQGLTAAQAMGLSRDELEVLYAASFRRLNARDYQAAVEAFGYLVMIDPLHAPNHYCLGVAWQGLGRMADAEKEFVNFLALDATNPMGYLRLGECFQHRGEANLAREAFELAEAECRNGHGDRETMEEARAKLALLKKDAHA